MQLPASLFVLLAMIGALAAAMPPQPTPAANDIVRSASTPSATTPSPSSSSAANAMAMPTDIQPHDRSHAATVPTTKLLPGIRYLSRPDTTDAAIGINFEDLRFDPPPKKPFAPEMLTARIRELLDKRVAIRGYIHPASAMVETGLTKLILVRDDQMMSFGPSFEYDANIVVEFRPGKSTDYSMRPITVVGKLSVNPSVRGEHTYSVFHLEAETANHPKSPSNAR